MAAIKDSPSVEVSKDGSKIRRTGNASLPAQVEGAVKKRDAKAEEKKVASDAKTDEAEPMEHVPIERDEQGRVQFCL